FAGSQFLQEAALSVCCWFRCTRNDFWFADRVASTIGGTLGNYLALLQRKEFDGGRDGRTRCERGVEKIEHLSTENRKMAADENEHLARRDDFLGITVAHLFGRLEAQHLIGGTPPQLHMI